MVVSPTPRCAQPIIIKSKRKRFTRWLGSQLFSTWVRANRYAGHLLLSASHICYMTLHAYAGSRRKMTNETIALLQAMKPSTGTGVLWRTGRGFYNAWLISSSLNKASNWRRHGKATWWPLKQARTLKLGRWKCETLIQFMSEDIPDALTKEPTPLLLVPLQMASFSPSMQMVTS